MTEYYGLKDLSPASLDELSNRILVDEQLAIKFYETKTQFGPESMTDSCDDYCR